MHDMATINHQTKPSHPPQSKFGITKDQDFEIKIMFEIYHPLVCERQSFGNGQRMCEDTVVQHKDSIFSST